MAKNHFGKEEIPHAELLPADIPSVEADWEAIARFALSFDAIRETGSFERCAAIANERRVGTLAEQRTCLYFEQRRWRHFAQDPDALAMEHIRSLIAAIHESVRGRGTE